MKKAVLVSLAAVAAALTVSSCADTLSDLELTVPSTSEIVLYSGQSQTCSFDVANSGGYLLKGTAVPSNPLYRAEVAINSQMDGGTVTVFAPEYIFKDEDFTVDVTVEDGINGRRKATTLQVKAKALENIQPFDTPANAFIAKPGSLVKIPAQRGANGGVLSFDAADLLWQDAQGLVKAVVLDPSDASSIYVELNADATGNAVVCAKASGQIVWSWHLWVTDYDPAASTMDWKDADGVTYSFMDRDLGAMTSVPGTDAAHGNFYNWGRKDPFPGAKFDAAEYKPAYNLAGEVVEFPKVDNEAVSNIEGSIANPLNRYLGVNAGGWSWITNNFSQIDKDAVKDLWGGVSGQKSMYDPCPAGWKVPSFAAAAFVSDAAVTKTKVYKEGAAAANNAMVGANFTVGGKDFFFPSMGESSWNGNLVNYVGGTWPCGKHWTNTADTFASSSYFRGGHYGHNTPSSAGRANINFGYYLAVRCVKE